jgi:hypothetical protein
MDLNTINLIIGGGIAIISSSLASILTNMFQSQDSAKKRKWELADKLTDKKFKMQMDRIDQTETLVIEIYNNAIQSSGQVEHLFKDQYNFNDLNNFIFPVTTKNQYLLAMCEMLNDDELNTLINTFTKSIFIFYDSIRTISENIKCDPTNAEIPVKFSKNLVGLIVPYREVIKRLGKLRIKVTSTMC